MMNGMTDFSYSNVPEQSSGWLIRFASFIVPGIKKVQRQIRPYALAWQQSNQQNVKQEGPVWIVLGDSMGQGIGASAHDKGWVGQLQQKLLQRGDRYRVINLSVSGAKVRDVLQKQLPAMHSMGLEPALVTVTVGSNDRGSRQNRKQLVEDFAVLLQQLPKGSVVASILGNFADIKRVDAHLREVEKTELIRVADVRNDIPSWRGKLSDDHYHPNDAGYTAMAESFYQAIYKD